MSDKKNNKNTTVLLIVCLAVIICAGTGFYLYRSNTPTSDKTIESAAFTSQNMQTSTKAINTPVSENESPISDVSTESQTVTTQQATGYSLPLSINQALNALEDHYGTDFKINSTVEENGFNYFAIYSGEEKYASVQVDLTTGAATETIISTGAKTDFDLV